MDYLFFLSLFFLLVGWAVIWVLHVIGARVLRRMGKPSQFSFVFSNKGFVLTRWLFAVFWLRLWVVSFYFSSPWAVKVGIILNIVIIVLSAATLMVVVESIASVVVHRNPLAKEDNLKARRIYTQTRVLARSTHFLLVILAISFVLLMLPGAKQIGASLLASAGVIGLIAGMAARPVVGNFISGLQIAFTQPIRIDDVVIIEEEWGRVEEITATYVVVKIWDERRLIVPLQWFVENIFQNWTHTTASLLGTVFLWVDYSVEIEPLKSEFQRLLDSSAQWDQRVCVTQVTDSHDKGMQLRFLMSAAGSGELFDLRCLVREGLITYLRYHQPHVFIKLRVTRDFSPPIEPLDVDSLASGKDPQ